MDENLSLEQIESELLEFLSTVELGQSKERAGELIMLARINHFIQASSGNPDYQGKSMAFRKWWGTILDALELKGDARSKMAASVRYSVGNAARKMLTEEQLEDAGLKSTSPRERGKGSYDRVASIHLLLTTAKIETPEDIELAANTIKRLFPRLPLKVQKDLLSELQD